MALTTNYDKFCPLFDFANSGGVLMPYFPMSLGQAAGNGKYVDFDTASVVFARVRIPQATRLITCEAFAVSDANALKGASASTEPVIGIVYGTSPLASIDAGTSIAVITCNATGDIGVRWQGTTTETTLATTDEIIIALKTAAASGTSANIDGAAVPVLWFANINSP